MRRGFAFLFASLAILSLVAPERASGARTRTPFNGLLTLSDVANVSKEWVDGIPHPAIEKPPFVASDYDSYKNGVYDSTIEGYSYVRLKNGHRQNCYTDDFIHAVPVTPYTNYLVVSMMRRIERLNTFSGIAAVAERDTPTWLEDDGDAYLHGTINHRLNCDSNTGHFVVPASVGTWFLYSNVCTNYRHGVSYGTVAIDGINEDGSSHYVPGGVVSGGRELPQDCFILAYPPITIRGHHERHVIPVMNVVEHYPD